MKRVYTLILLLCLMAGLCVTADAADVVYCRPEGQPYQLALTENSDGTLTVTGSVVWDDASYASDTLVIPSQADGKAITAIADRAFLNTSFTTLELNEGLETIGYRAFYNCSGFTGDLTIPDGVVSIGKEAFMGCSGFTGDLTIGEGVETIAYHAFRGCSGMRGQLSLPQSLKCVESMAFYGLNLTGGLSFGPHLEYIGTEAFNRCKALDGQLTFAATTAENCVIDKGAFGYCESLSLPADQTLVIPEGITTIADDAFYSCEAMYGSLQLPDSLVTLGSRAFGSCSFSGTLDLGSGLTSVGHSAFSSCSFTGELRLPESLTSISDGLFYNNSSFTGELTIPESVTSIGDQAFYQCTGFTGELRLPEKLTGIGNRAFLGCTGLAGDLTIPAGVTSIGDEAFSGCYGFTGELKLGDGLRSIGKNAFYKCFRFTGELRLPEGLTSIGGYAFYQCSGFTGDLTIPDSVTSVGEYAFTKCSGFTGSLTLSDGLTELPYGVFSDCTGLTGTLKLPAGLTAINISVFENCSGLTGDLILPDSVTYIDKKAFDDCRGFNGKLELPAGLTYIGDYAFNACIGLTGALDLPDGITYIGNYAFNACESLEGELLLPLDLQVLGKWAFYGCKGLSGRVTLPDTLTYLGSEAFFACGSDLSVDPDLPDSITYIGAGAFYDMAQMTGQLHLPASLTKIDARAFYGCTGLTGPLTLPSGLTYIGDYAFYNCPGLTGDLIIPMGVTNIRSLAFFGCTGLSGTVKFPYGTYAAKDAINGCPSGTLWVPTDLNSDALVNILGGATTVYYGGTQEQWAARADASYLNPNATIHYESYPSCGLDISGGENFTYQAGQTFVLEAEYYNSVAQEDLSFTWSSDRSDVIRLDSSSCTLSKNGYTARVTAVFTALSEGTAAITVSGGGLTDSATVTATDFKKITFCPPKDRQADDPIPVLLGESTTLCFEYVTWGDAAAEMADIQWTVDGGEGFISLSDISNTAEGTRTATLTATVTGLAVSEPIRITVSGPGGSQDSCLVVVPEDKLTILRQDGTVPDEGEIVSYSAGTGETFTLYLQYETQAEESVVAEKLKALVWEQASADFFIHPDDRFAADANPTRRGSTIALPLEQPPVWNKIEDGVYRVEVVFAAALEGACGLTVSADTYTKDKCMVSSTFDSSFYQAKLLHDTTNPTTVDVYEMLQGPTPATALLDTLRSSGGYLTATAAWETIKGTFSAVEDPSKLYDLTIRQEDLYYGLLLEALSGIMEEGPALRAQNAVQFGNDLVNTVADGFRMVYDADISALDPYDVFSDSFRKELIVGSFQNRYKGFSKASDLLKKADLIATTVDGFQDFERRLSSALLLQGITDSMTTVLQEMLDQCANYSGDEALETALQRCLEQVERSSDILFLRISAGALEATGIKATQKLFGLLWENVIDGVKTVHPAAAAAFTAYHTGTTVSNVLYATDATLEEYYKLAALQNIKTVARDAHDVLSASWQSDTEAYLASLQLLFHLHLLDCDHALAYVDTVDSALRSQIIQALGATGFDRAEDAFASFRSRVEVLYQTYQVMWVDYVEADYPGVLLDEGYADIYANILGIQREVLIACPVDVYVVTPSGDIVAYAAEGKVHSSVEDVSILLDDDQKTVVFSSDASYFIRMTGTGQGVMNIIDTTYASGQPVRTLFYRDLPLQEGTVYTSRRFNKLLSGSGAAVSPSADSSQEATYTLTMVSAAADTDSGMLSTCTARAGQILSIAAVVPEGYTFAGWLCDSDQAVFADAESPVTQLYMPVGDITVTALLRVTDENVPSHRLTLTDADGYIQRSIPLAPFTLRVSTGDYAGLLAAYDAEGKLLAVRTAAENGLVTAALDNSDGSIARVALFRVKSLQDPVPVAAPMELR